MKLCVLLLVVCLAVTVAGKKKHDEKKHGHGHGGPVCNRNTGGSCKWLGCSASRGPTMCVDGSCLCSEGSYCAVDGICVPATFCRKDTPGTCSVMGCGRKRGDVDCVEGKCVCKKGACSVNGVCEQRCSKDTGGSCKVLACKASRHAICDSSTSSCVCGENECAYKGTCMSGEAASLMGTDLATNTSSGPDMDQENIGSLTDMVATYFDRVPDHDDPVLLSMVAAIFASVVVFVRVMRRGQASSVSAEPLLGE